MAQETPLQSDETQGDLELRRAPDTRAHPTLTRTRYWRISGALLISAIGLSVLLWTIGVFGGNVRTVVPGQVYRSAQLTGHNYTALTAAWSGLDLDSVLRVDKIKTVLNLRGGSMANDYYRGEVLECNRLGIAHVDVPLSAIRLPPPARMVSLLYTLDHARYPILIHCQGGSDRTGLVCALYLNIYKQIPLDRALRDELTWRYGHFSFTRARAMDRFFALYRDTGRGLTLRQWIVTVYPAVYSRQTAIR